MAIGKGKGGRSRGGEQTGVPMGPMIDVVFLLLIYFIVTFKQITPEAHLAMNLPGQGGGSSDAEPLNMMVLPGEYRLRSKPLTLDTIESTLMSFAENNPNVTVVIKMSEDAPTKQLVNLLDICKKAGLKKLNVLTLKGD